MLTNDQGVLLLRKFTGIANGGIFPLFHLLPAQYGGKIADDNFMDQNYFSTIACSLSYDWSEVIIASDNASRWTGDNALY